MAGNKLEIILKSPSEIEKMRVAGRLAGQVLEMIAPYVKPGISTLELDEIMRDYIENKEQAISACFNYQGYPRYTCISVNEEVCHGIPSPAHHLREGDIVNIDVTVIKEGFHGDTSMMFIVGDKTTPLRQRVCQCAQESMYAAIRAVGPGRNLQIVGQTIAPLAHKYGFSIVRDYTGHGIGQGFHEDPPVFHHVNHVSVILEPGMTFTIEPMINAGTWKCRVNHKNGWTVTTRDKMPSAQYEHTVLITDDGVEVLTLREHEDFPRILHTV
ncbi:MAG: type I methionyl aminopeptidase [Candidatus Anaerobiospirillum merdipullorum]|uniref:Methionine aminopeptidase n=1 Tax=Candidatus Anaerobiospirillum merdipullorum TaxID=2838450 RepID=A0A9E2KNH9_9GAMM|nr:type I methionyl aminopeptidase [Candidatus Anaerobiospirillum merdipullorum]